MNDLYSSKDTQLPMDLDCRHSLFTHKQSQTCHLQINSLATASQDDPNDKNHNKSLHLCVKRSPSTFRVSDFLQNNDALSNNFEVPILSSRSETSGEQADPPRYIPSILVIFACCSRTAGLGGTCQRRSQKLEGIENVVLKNSEFNYERRNFDVDGVKTRFSPLWREGLANCW